MFTTSHESSVGDCSCGRAFVPRELEASSVYQRERSGVESYGLGAGSQIDPHRKVRAEETQTDRVPSDEAFTSICEGLLCEG